MKRILVVEDNEMNMQLVEFLLEEGGYGIVKANSGMIAVVTNPQARTYFLREGDRLYDGAVEKISMDGVTFHEEGKDAFGKPVERQVNKRIYSIAGEQQ